MKRGVGIAMASLALAVAAASPASAEYWRDCGSQPRPGAGWYQVRAHGIGCGKARDVAHRYTWSAFSGNPAPRPFGFRCQEAPAGYELARVACRREEGGLMQKVRFSYGA